MYRRYDVFTTALGLLKGTTIGGVTVSSLSPDNILWWVGLVFALAEAAQGFMTNKK